MAQFLSTQWAHVLDQLPSKGRGRLLKLSLLQELVENRVLHESTSWLAQPMPITVLVVLFFNVRIANQAL